MSLPSGHLPGSPNAVRKASPLAAISGVQAGCTARIDPQVATPHTSTRFMTDGLSRTASATALKLTHA